MAGKGNRFGSGTAVKKTSSSAPSTTKHANSAFVGGKKSGAAANINKKK
jgi:hypothetical protein